jgi:hypothetical protein
MQNFIMSNNDNPGSHLIQMYEKFVNINFDS